MLEIPTTKASSASCWLRFGRNPRGPNGFRCPRCGAREAHEVAERALPRCRSCRCQASVTAGTVLHRTHVPLRLRLAAAYPITTRTPGFSAVQLQRRLGLARHETAWTMRPKLRRATFRPERDRLSGVVEVRGRGSGRVRPAVVRDLPAASPVPFVEAAVEPGRTVLTHGWQGHAPLREAYEHRPSTVGDRKNAPRLLARVHRTFSNLKTWLKGTHHGVSEKHLPHDVDEFVFRFNRRRTPMAAFQSLLGLSTQHAPTTHKMLYAAEPTG